MTTPIQLRNYLELIRFSHTVFALPFALLGVVLAAVVPQSIEPTGGLLLWRTGAVIACMVTARSAAMAFNRLVDAAIDARNPRTATRHLPSGRLSSSGVWAFFGLMTLGFIASCALFLPNWIPLVGAVPVLAWICGYSYAKRFTSAAHLWLGIALALSPVCAWLAVRGEQVLMDPSDIGPAVGLALAIALWVMGFDIVYACQDAGFDREQGLHSVPARFGVSGALKVAAIAHSLMLVVLAAWPWFFPQLQLGAVYFGCLAVVAGLVIVQHRLVRPDDLGRVNVAFFHVNAIISFGLSAATALDAWLL
ncbi:MAG: UbiA family prenyltransferase [Pirellulaceae bacterium]|nr:UbiA family prenyltransferase [Pirellulaceae bacterium]